MAQNYITIDGVVIRQPDEGLGYDFETTYTEDTTRTRTGVLYASPMFTVESLSYETGRLTVAEMAQLLTLVVGRTFTLHYFSPYYGAWRDGRFYVGKGSMAIGALADGGEWYESLSFNMIGVDPI